METDQGNEISITLGDASHIGIGLNDVVGLSVQPFPVFLRDPVRLAFALNLVPSSAPVCTEKVVQIGWDRGSSKLVFDGPNDKLVGGHGTISGDRAMRTVGSHWPYATTAFYYLRRAMTLTEPLSLLTDDEVYAVIAYLLALNGIIEEDQVLDAQTLPKVKMPNSDNFVWAYQEGGE